MSNLGHRSQRTGDDDEEDTPTRMYKRIRRKGKRHESQLALPQGLSSSSSSSTSVSTSTSSSSTAPDASTSVSTSTAIEINSLIRKMLVNNFADYFPNNEVLHKYLLIKAQFGADVSLIIMGFVFEPHDVVILNDFKLLSWNAIQKEGQTGCTATGSHDNCKLVYQYLLDSLKYNNVDFAAKITAHLLNQEQFISFLCDVEYYRMVIWSCKIHKKSLDWVTAQVKNILTTCCAETCKRFLPFLNKFGEKDLYTLAVRTHPSLIAAQLEVPALSNVIELLILAINANVLRVEADSDSFQVLPYNNNDEAE